jgi:hypothetical protein
MSVHRENITWVSRDGTWNRGFYDYYNVNTESDDFDFEWDVEYDYSRFNWVSTGHATQEEADAAWDGSNPGCGEVISEPSVATDKLDALAKACKK